MANDDDSARPARVPFFRTASDDETVDVEAFIVAYCDVHVRAQSMWVSVRGKRRNWQRNPVQFRERRCRYSRTLPYDGHLREHVKEEMRAEVESAAHAGSLTLRDKFDHILRALPNRGLFDPFAGVFARSADLESFAVVHWSVRNEPKADETPQQRRAWAADLYAQTKNYAEVGRALGVSITRARQLVKEAQPTAPVDAARKSKRSKGEK